MSTLTSVAHYLFSHIERITHTHSNAKQPLAEIQFHLFIEKFSSIASFESALCDFGVEHIRNQIKIDEFKSEELIFELFVFIRDFFALTFYVLYRNTNVGLSKVSSKNLTCTKKLAISEIIILSKKDSI